MGWAFDTYFLAFFKRIKPFGIKVEEQYEENLLYPAIKPMIASDFSFSRKKVSNNIWRILFLVFLQRKVIGN